MEKDKSLPKFEAQFPFPELATDKAEPTKIVPRKNNSMLMFVFEKSNGYDFKMQYVML